MVVDAADPVRPVVDGRTTIEDLTAGIAGLRRNDEYLTAGGLNKEGLTWLLTNGADRLICRPELHAGEAKDRKSPASIAAVGT